jgi:integrase
MSSLYLRGQTWWAKSKEQGQVVRWSLKTRSKVEARRRLKLYDSQPRREPMPARVKSPVTWDKAAEELLAYYEAYGTRRVSEAAGKARTLSRYFQGMKLGDIDAPMILRYVARRRAEGKAANTVNVELATLRRALRLAQELGHLASVPTIRSLRPAPPRSGFFEPGEFEAVAQELPPDLALVARIGYTYGWRLTDEVLPLTRSQVDLEAGTLRLQPGSTKNGDGRIVYLTPELKATLIEQLGRVHALERELSRVIPYVFPVFNGPYKGGQRRDIRKVWRAACRRAGYPSKLKHDLRRTAARNMVNAGISERVAMRITGHRTRSTFDRYHVVSPGDLRDAARKIAQAKPHTAPVQSGAQSPNGEAATP